jgi:hypothetical protein
MTHTQLLNYQLQLGMLSQKQAYLNSKANSGNIWMQRHNSMLAYVYTGKVKVKQSRYTPWRRLGGEV